VKKILLLLFCCCCFSIQRIDSTGSKDQPDSGFSCSAHVAAFAAAGLCGWIAADCFIQYKKNIEERADQKSQKSKRKRVSVFGGLLGYFLGTVEG
jgi:hypothetical protein